MTNLWELIVVAIATGGLLRSLVVIAQIVWLEGLLSIDNAAVLAAMASQLPDDKKAPWPVGRLGNQRNAALKAGLLGAYLGRGLMLVFASVIIHFRTPEVINGVIDTQVFWVIPTFHFNFPFSFNVPGLPIFSIIGALYLLNLSREYFFGGESEKSEEPTGSSSQFWKVVLAVELADLAFSIDNVVAIIAFTPNLYLILAGVGIGILCMRFAAIYFIGLIKKEPALEPAAYLLIAVVAIELLARELVGIEIPDLVQFGISLTVVACVVSHARVRRRRNPQTQVEAEA